MGSSPYFFAMKIKMRFTGQARDKVTGKIKKWRKGEVVEGEFDDLLPDTFLPFKHTMAEPDRRPVVKRRRRATRKK